MCHFATIFYAQGQLFSILLYTHKKHQQACARLLLCIHVLCSPKKFGPQTSSYSTALLLSSYSMVTSTCSLRKERRNTWEAEKKEETLSSFFSASQILEEGEEGLGTRLLYMYKRFPSSTNHYYTHVNERSMPYGDIHLQAPCN